MCVCVCLVGLFCGCTCGFVLNVLVGLFVMVWKIWKVCLSIFFDYEPSHNGVHHKDLVTWENQP